MRKLPVLSVVLVLLLTAVSCGPQTPAPAASPAAVPAISPEPAVSPEPAAESTPAPAAPEPSAPAAAVPEPAVPVKPLAGKDKKAPAVSDVSKTSAPNPAPPAPVQPAPAAVSAAPAPPAAPAVPPPAPDLKLEPAAVFQAGPGILKTAALPGGTVVKYTLDGSDPASGKPWPAAGLTVNQTGKVRVWAAQPGGDAATAEAAVTIGEVWVQPGSAGDGSWSQPLGTVDEGLAKASTLGVKRLKLVSGAYTTKTDLSGTWELSGGWKAPGEAGAASVISGTKQSGSTQKEPAYTLKVATGASVVLVGLEVRSPNSSFGAAVLVDKDAAAEVSRSRLVGGSGLYGYGLKVSGAGSVTVADSSLYGGDGGSSFALSAEKSTVKVIRSTLDAGTGNAVSYGANITLSKLTLVSSVVWGGAANSSYGVGLYSADGCSVLNSTILGGKGTQAWALYLSESEPEIVGCLIGSAGKTKSYGIFANYGNSLPKSLRSNGFFGSSSGAFSGAALGEISAAPGAAGAFTDASGNALAGQKANLKAEPAFGPAPDYRTLPSSPAVLLKGSEALAGDAALDRAGKPRGASPAFGAWAISP